MSDVKASQKGTRDDLRSKEKSSDINNVLAASEREEEEITG